MRVIYAACCFLLLSTVALAQQPAPETAPGSAAQAATAVTPPAHPITLEQTTKMFELMDFQKTMDSIMNQMIAMQTRQVPFMPASVWDDFRETFKKTDFVTLFLPVYQKYLSEEDAAKSLEFYETPSGKRMLRAMPLMMGDISTIAGQKGQEIGQAVIQRHMDEIQAAAKKYQQEHPSQDEPSSGPAAGAPKPDSPK